MHILNNNTNDFFILQVIWAEHVVNHFLPHTIYSIFCVDKPLSLTNYDVLFINIFYKHDFTSWFYTSEIINLSFLHDIY